MEDVKLEAFEGYAELADILGCSLTTGGSHALLDALRQSAVGKGKERHANDLPWIEQPILAIQRRLGHDGFGLGQAAKKVIEASRFRRAEQQRHEVLGTLVYLASAARVLDEQIAGEAVMSAGLGMQMERECPSQFMAMIDAIELAMITSGLQVRRQAIQLAIDTVSRMLDNIAPVGS